MLSCANSVLGVTGDTCFLASLKLNSSKEVSMSYSNEALLSVWANQAHLV